MLDSLTAICLQGSLVSGHGERVPWEVLEDISVSLSHTHTYIYTCVCTCPPTHSAPKTRFRSLRLRPELHLKLLGEFRRFGGEGSMRRTEWVS